MGEAMGDPTPLQERIAEFVDEEIMMAIAAEFRTGRILLISTTNLDVGRAVTWNIGRIADSGAPAALGTGGGTSDARFIKDYAPVAELGLLSSMAHKVDERVSLEDLSALGRIYEEVLQRFFAA